MSKFHLDSAIQIAEAEAEGIRAKGLCRLDKCSPLSEEVFGQRTWCCC